MTKYSRLNLCVSCPRPAISHFTEKPAHLSEKWYFKTLTGAVILIATRFAIVSEGELGNICRLKIKHFMSLILPNQIEYYRVLPDPFYFNCISIFLYWESWFPKTGYDRIRISHRYSFPLSTLHMQQSQNNSTDTATTNI